MVGLEIIDYLSDIFCDYDKLHIILPYVGEFINDT